MNKLLLSTLALAALFATGCRKRPDPVVPNTAGNGRISVEITNQVNGLAMQLGNWYQTPNGDSVKISNYKYYISNISLTTIDGKTFTAPQSYHLIDQASLDRRRFVIEDVPQGQYTGIRFLIGVDSLHNVSGAQEGDLDPKYGMIWTWNSGYIMAKMEGKSPSVPASADSSFFFHVAGFREPASVLQWVTLSFPSTAEVTATNKPNVHITSDVMKWFSGPNNIRLAQVYNVMETGRAAQQLAENYREMFAVNHIDQ